MFLPFDAVPDASAEEAAVIDPDLLTLISLGYQWSPLVRSSGEGKGFSEFDFENPEHSGSPFIGMKQDHPFFASMVLAYQVQHPFSLDALSPGSPKFDSVRGSVTKELIRKPRCGHPDFRNPSHAVGEANWPQPCRNQLTWSVDPQMKLPGMNYDQIAETCQAAFNQIQSQLIVKFIRELGRYPNTRFYERAARLSPGVLARNLLAHNDCNSRVWGEVSTRFTWNHRKLLPTLVHEFGHGIGMNHVDDPSATMYYAITDASTNRGGEFNESDLREARKIGYTVRTEPEPPDPTDPPDPDQPSGTQLAAVGDIELFNAGQEPIVIPPRTAFPVKYGLKQAK